MKKLFRRIKSNFKIKFLLIVGFGLLINSAFSATKTGKPNILLKKEGLLSDAE